MSTTLNRTIIALLMGLICGCTPPSLSINGVDDNSLGDDSRLTIVSIEYLKTLCGDNPIYITQDIAVEGVITANDAYGEFPNRLIIEDESGAIEVECDFDCTTSGFIFGSTLRVLCSGLWVATTSGVLAIGSAPDGQYGVSAISEAYYDTHLRLSSDVYIIPIPMDITLSDLSVNHILRYVRIANLSSDESDSIRTFCSRNTESGATEYTLHTLLDGDGATITLTVDKGVIYADEDLPDGLFTIYAIVEYFSGEYRVRITNCGY